MDQFEKIVKAVEREGKRALVEAWKEISAVERPFLKLYLLLVLAAASIEVLEYLVKRLLHWIF